MSTRRSRATQQLPKYVYVVNHWYIYRPYLGVFNEKIIRGKDIKLCSADEPVYVLWQRYQQPHEKNHRNLEWLLGEYQKSHAFEKLVESTKKDWSKWIIPQILETPVAAPYNFFGNVPLEHIDTVTLRHYLDKLDTKHKRTLHLKIIRNAWKNGIQYNRGLPNNPCSNITGEASGKSKRYVTDEDYYPVLEIASPRAYALLEIGYICRARMCEIIKMTIDRHVLEEG